MPEPEQDFDRGDELGWAQTIAALRELVGEVVTVSGQVRGRLQLEEFENGVVVVMVKLYRLDLSPDEFEYGEAAVGRVTIGTRDGRVVIARAGD